MLKNILKLNYKILCIKNVGYTPSKSNSLLIRYLKTEYSTLPNITNEEQNDIKDSKVTIDKEKMLKILQLEVDVARQEGRRVPDPTSIKEAQWDHLLNLKSRSARIKYYAYLWQLEKKRESREIKKIQKREEIAERRARLTEENQQNEHIIYGIGHTTFLLRVYDTTINNWQNNKLINAMKFGSKIVLDCGFDDNMNKREASNTAKQLMLLFADNRIHDDPFDLHFCNVNLNKDLMKVLQKHIPTIFEPSFPLNVHEKCFTEIFPKERIVYLTPHCKTELHSFNPDDIYVIGAIVDKVNNDPLSLAKAKRLGIRMARLPLDRYLTWSSGSGKSLTLDQMINIMLDIKTKNDWNNALRHVPRRKIVNDWQQKSREEKVKIRAKKFEFDISTWGDSKTSDQKNPFKN
ncbi:mitochondrial ribonuclease P protein 1 homolog [Condylostylus longicornis]|uniref:mitochondrial ribonuclease P protein 1 homolog n=1 Tax=Condylostylus longicornis TaxID=2530218 RepID=UPI00244E53B9|nr:mitochondrial ribonuclease P protein 1 homolog [Condylostylus longicornis]